jgi:hypothetical protein
MKFHSLNINLKNQNCYSINTVHYKPFIYEESLTACLKMIKFEFNM